jgi:GST-like protein
LIELLGLDVGRADHLAPLLGFVGDESQIEPRRYLLGDELSVLDLYVATISRWSPRRTRFYGEAPKMAAIVRRVDADPRLAELWGTRFPFHEGWEG